MNVKETKTPAWSDPGQVIECHVEGQVFGKSGTDRVGLRLRVDEVLEEFDRRRVLVASAQEIIDSDDLSDDGRDAFLHPTYLIEETSRFEEDGRHWPDDIRELVRSPVAVEVDEGLQRSVFVDNVGVSVGDLVDLVRGELDIEQVQMVFRAVGDLFSKLHDSNWVHLGLTPWNIRVFDTESKDGFPQLFISKAMLDEPSDPIPQTAQSTEAEQGHTDSVDLADGNEDNPFGVQERTVVELKPYGVSDGDGGEDVGQTQEEEQSGSEPSFVQDSDANWSELSGDTAPAEAASLEAILDGIDRLYRSGKVDDEIAVTPGFSAPELLSGMGSEDGETADIFSLGMFLYFLIAGVVPPASVYTRYAPAIPARNFRPTFPPGLQAVISRATRPRPEDRFASVRTLMEAFDDACQVMQERAQRTPDESLGLQLACDTHIGIAKRKRNPTNQDSVFSATSEDGRFSLIVVADGVSTASYGSGDLASHALTSEATKVWDDVLPSYLMDEEIDEVDIILEVLRRANHHIVDYVNEHHAPFRGSPHEVMGSTALIAVIIDGVVTLGSLGDSRVYLQRGAGMEQMTIDHNLWTLSILEGVEADSALAMPHGDALARCLGTFIVDDGELEAVSPQPDLFRFQVTREDTLLLTTDGLVDFAGTNLLAAEDNILSILLAEPDPALACLELILLANRGGGGDNIGLSVARFF